MLDVIIPTKNSGTVLENCLKTLRAQTKPVNVIIVDARSTDNTIEIAKKYGCLVVEEPKSNVRGSRRAVACNEGLKHSTSKDVAFLDSDTEIPPTWAEDMEDMATKLDTYGAFTSGCEPDISTKLSQAINKIMKIASNHARKYSTNTEVKSVPGYNAVYSRRAIDEAGGFSEDIGGCEDWELNYRIRKNGHVLFGIPKSPVVHKERVSYKAFHKQMRGYGWSWGRLLKTKHIFMFSRAIPAIALIMGIILNLVSIVVLPAFLVIELALCLLALEIIPDEFIAFVIMQLSLAIGYIDALLF